MINTISSFLKKWPLHLFLLPVFFISSAYVKLAGLLPVNDFLWALLKVTGYLLLFFAILYAFYKEKTKAGVLATLGGIAFLFFGTLKDMLDSLPLLEYISSYKILLPLLLMLGIFCLYKARKARSLPYTTLLLNILFIIYLGIEVVNLSGLAGGSHLINKDNTRLLPPGTKNAFPDIYYIVMDSYPSSQYQREILGASYNSLDSALSARGFFLLQNPVSNYNYTAFAIASVFQLQYVHWLKGVIKAEPHHYSDGAIEIKRSIVPAWLKENGYTLYNLSIFDFPGQPSVSQSKFFFAITPEIIFRHTLWSRVKWQVIPTLFPSYVKNLEAEQKKLTKKELGFYRTFNNHMLDSLGVLPSAQKVSPKFIYAHFEMPHYPYFYDSTGKAYPDSEIYSSSMSNNKNRISNYIEYINRKMTSLVDSIRHSDNGQSVIILQSDHGFRDIRTPNKADVFKNYSAFYFPDNDYHLLYDSMSNVNTFRIVFNKYFGQQLPLLKDSSIYLKY